MRIPFLIFLVCMLLIGCGNEKVDNESKTLLAIFAHPDDEAAIAQLLVKYSRTHKVYLLILTDGRYGIKPGFPTGDTLVKLRQGETACACETMGIQPPIFLSFPDGFDTRIGVGEYFTKSKALKEKLKAHIEKINPDFIITFGPDGDTGHSDHRMASNMTTEVILHEGWAERFPLYYLAWDEKADEKFDIIGGLNTVDPKYYNVTIKYSDADERSAMRAIQCYKSQLSPEEMQAWRETEEKDSSNVFYFRQLHVKSEMKEDFTTAHE
jgi:N-acetylglucosamine malate deacetylase 2